MLLLAVVAAAAAAIINGNNRCANQLILLCNATRGDFGNCLVCCGAHGTQLSKAGCHRDDFIGYCNSTSPWPPPPSPVPPTQSCADTLKRLCNVSDGYSSCVMCCGAHETNLSKAGCHKADFVEYCNSTSSSPSPAPSSSPSSWWHRELEYAKHNPIVVVCIVGAMMMLLATVICCRRRAYKQHPSSDRLYIDVTDLQQEHGSFTNGGQSKVRAVNGTNASRIAGGLPVTSCAPFVPQDPPHRPPPPPQPPPQRLPQQPQQPMSELGSTHEDFTRARIELKKSLGCDSMGWPS